MSYKMLIDGNHPEETRVVVVSGNKVENFDFESSNRRQVSGNIYLAKVTRVEPSLQAAFLEYGGNRHGFLAFSEIHPDYYQIPQEDKARLLEEAKLEASSLDYEAEQTEASPSQTEKKSKSRVRSRKKSNKKVLAEDASAEASDIISEPLKVGASDKGHHQDYELRKEVSPTDVDDKPKNQDLDGYSNLEAKDDKEPEVSELTNEGTEVEIRRAAAKRRKSLLRKYNIQEVIKVRQIMLVQVVKEERGNKGAALTSYLSLAGRYCVLMPNTTRGGGISRKITNPSDRRRLKEITSSITVPDTAGLIIRTAGINRTKIEIKRDYEYLIRQWENIRDFTLKSIAPTLIYEEGSLIKRSIRDLYNKPTEEIIVQGDDSYVEAKEYMKMLMPSHAKNVKKYSDVIPLFSRYQVETHLTAMFNPNVQLRSGGYIVIGTTEALVAIDVNSGRSTRETSIEETALKTNLEAAEEIARQLKLRDLAGLIVIDFIDMEDRKNNMLVEKALYEKIKTDRARIQLGKISSFGLLEMSRQRLRFGMVESTTQPCQHCFGTGTTRSNESLGLAILRDIQQEINTKNIESIDIECSVEVSNFLLNMKRQEIFKLESELGVVIHIIANKSIINPSYKISKEKSATKVEDGNPVESNKGRKQRKNNVDSEVSARKSQADDSEIQKRNRRKRKKTSAQQIPTDTSSSPEVEIDLNEASKHTSAPLKTPEEGKKRLKNKRSKESSDASKPTISPSEVTPEAVGVGVLEKPSKKEQKKRLTSADNDDKSDKKNQDKKVEKNSKKSIKKVGWWSKKTE